MRQRTSHWAVIALVTAFLTVTASLVHAAPSSRAGYDPNADPNADLAAAKVVAQESGRRILLKVGGEWCSWCHALEKFVHSTPAVEKALKKNYVVVKVNYSDENENAEFLSQYPEIAGYPHIFVLEGDGSLLHSQNTGDLEAGEGYDTQAFTDFLNTWSPDKG